MTVAAQARHPTPLIAAPMITAAAMGAACARESAVAARVSPSAMATPVVRWPAAAVRVRRLTSSNDTAQPSSIHGSLAAPLK
jgi:hypothetical protein